MSKTREFSFDILRVIAMCMVIIIHVSNVYSRNFGFISDSSYLASLIFNTISRISVPIFLMISGALLVDRSFNKEKYFKRIIKYIILIITWDIIYLVWEYLYLGVTYNKLYNLIFEPYRAHLWFLYTILTLYIIQPLIKLVLDKTSIKIKYLLLFIWLLFSTLSIVNSVIANAFTLFSYIGFFVLGKYLYEYVKNNDIRKYNISLILLIIISLTTSVILNYSYSHRYNTFYNLFFAYRTPFIILASCSVYALVIGNYKKNSIPKVIELLSSLSLGVYLVHGIFLDVTIQEFNYQSLSSIIGIPVFSILIFLASIAVIDILKKIKYINNLVE